MKTIFLLFSLFSFSLHAQTPPDSWNQRPEDILKEIQKNLKNLPPESQKFFEEMFGGDFEKMSQEMIKELQILEKQLQGWPSIAQSLKGVMPYDVNDADIIQKETDEAIEITIKIPNFAGGNVNVQAQENSVLLEGQIHQYEAVTDPNGQTVNRKEYTKNIYKQISLSQKIDPDKIEYRNQKDGIVLILPKKK